VNSHGSREIYVGKTTVTQAITSAGGLTDFANPSKIMLIRADGQRIKVDYNEALQDQTKDPEIYPGDQVNVPRKFF
jgi:protein involved in polysaccharide export with SLBB domain